LAVVQSRERDHPADDAVRYGSQIAQSDLLQNKTREIQENEEEEGLSGDGAEAAGILLLFPRDWIYLRYDSFHNGAGDRRIRSQIAKSRYNCKVQDEKSKKN